MLVCRVRYKWLQQAGSCISRPVREYYNFFHFPTPVEIKVGDELIHTRPNACIFLKPMEPRWFYFAKDTTMNWMHAYVDISDLLEKYDIPLNCVFYPSNPGFISDVFRKMMKEDLSSNSYREEILDSYATEFLIKLSRAVHAGTAPTEISSEEQRRIRDLQWEILSQPEKKWTVSDMAKMASLSPSRFHAVYKAMFGSSPMKDVIAAKVDYAKALLLVDEHMTLADVAERLGYNNQYHFIRQFKAVTGMTPGVYRKHN